MPDSTAALQVISGMIGLAAAALSKFIGRRHDWIPLPEPKRDLAQQVTVAFSAVVIAALWFSLGRTHRSGALLLIAIVLLSIGVALFVLLSHVLAQHKFVISKPGFKTVVLGGFELTHEARPRLEQGIGERELIESVPTKPHLVWTQKSLAVAETRILILFISMSACGSIGLAAMGFAFSGS